MANTLAYYDTATIAVVKSFTVQAPGVFAILVNFIKRFHSSQNKIACLSLDKSFKASLTPEA